MVLTRPLAVVTGASSGIGRAFARRLAADGHDVALVARDRERLEALAAELHRATGVDAQPWVCDLGDRAQRDVLLARVAAAAPAILIHAAGLLTSGPFESLALEREREAVEVMVTATMELAHAALPAMLARRAGALVVVSSRAAFVPARDIATYSACKAFANQLVLSLAERCRASDVRVLAVCPGNTRTEIFDRAGVDTAGFREAEWSTPEEIVDAALQALAAGATLCVPREPRRDVVLRRMLPRRLLVKASGVLRRLSRT